MQFRQSTVCGYFWTASSLYTLLIATMCATLHLILLDFETIMRSSQAAPVHNRKEYGEVVSTGWR